MAHYEPGGHNSRLFDRCPAPHAQSIGRRYRRQDEIGTPLAVTVDFDTLDDDAVTIRDRDTMEQIRVPVNKINESITNRLDELTPHIPEMDEINV